MKLFKQLAALLSFLVIVGMPVIASALSTQDFYINSFIADYYLGRTDNNISTVRVEEEIVATFPNFDQNHGILRVIPKTYKKHSLGIHIDSVTDTNNRAYQYDTYTENDNLVLKIGDPDSYVHGRTVYRIRYQLREVISFEDTHDELYWDVNGDQWSQQFGEVTSRLHIPANIAASIEGEALCFTGRFGSTAKDCTVHTSENRDEMVITTKAQNLQPNETLTFVTSFSKGTFAPDKLAALWRKIVLGLKIGAAILPPLFTLLVAIKIWRAHGRDKKAKGVIVPEYLPPRGMNVLLSDVVLREGVRTQAISATIIELAIKKYLALYEIETKKFLSKKTEYELELLKLPSDLPQEEQQVIRSIFSTITVGERVNMNTLKNKLHTEVKKLDTMTSKLVYQKGYFVLDPAQAKKRFIVPAVVLMVAGFVAWATIILIPLGIGLLISAVILFFGTGTMPARTVAGAQLRDYLLGMEMYMKLAEAERIKYLQSPVGVRQFGDPKNPKTKIKLFEKLLPYAMLFGIEKEWAEQFKDLYTQPPDWYRGSRTFSAAHLGSSLHSFGSVAAASFTAPSSSGSSGSGGGGFSGGGGGGGGGGGW